MRTCQWIINRQKPLNELPAIGLNHPVQFHLIMAGHSSYSGPTMSTVTGGQIALFSGFYLTKATRQREEN